ncbi:MAG: hypothetical protein DRJ31_11110, partial [Candidatus Methanomethylicota archaeon]
MKKEGLKRPLFRVMLTVLCSSILILGSFSACMRSISAVGYSAWLKIVTTSWNGVPDPSALPGNFMPMFPAGEGFADRFNVTGQEAFVEVYGIKPEASLIQLQGTFEPNATGFVKISWTVEDNWGLLILVKAKSYYGEKIGAESPFKGIIMYALLIPPTSPSDDAKAKLSGITGGVIDTTEVNSKNASVHIDGSYDEYSGLFDFSISGVFDYLSGPSVNLASFATIFGNETSAGTPVNAWVAKAAKIFKVFHVHSWYDIKDNLSFAQIKIYDLDHTDPTSEASLIQAAVTGEDGQSRYTREIYPPEEVLTGGKFEDNPYVPIPLQIFRLVNSSYGEVFTSGTSTSGISPGSPIRAPHLNATVRVWWETVIVNQTLYYGNYINGSLTATALFPLGKSRLNFVGPLNVYHNATKLNDKYPVTNFINATVFYAHFCAFDDDREISFPSYDPEEGRYMEVYARYVSMDVDGDGDAENATGDQLINAEVSINLKTTNDVAYYMTENVLTTNITGCTDDPHKYRGGLINDMARFPNATIWYSLYYEDPEDDDSIPEYLEDRGIGSFWENFGDYIWLNVSFMYNPADADNYENIPEGPNLRDVANPARIGDEDVLESDYYNGNWSMLVSDVSYTNTLTLTDDKEYDGLDVLVLWKGEWQNTCLGNEKLVGEIRIKNPYEISLARKTWVTQLSFAINPDLTPTDATAEWITWDAPIVVLDESVLVGFNRGRVNMTTYVYDVVFQVVDALGNTLPASDTEVDLRLPNGNFITREPSIDETLYTGVMWSYRFYGEGNVTFFQLPGAEGPYGVRVLYQGIEVYYNIDEIDVLTKTTIVRIRTNIYKIKLVFYDCNDELLPQIWVKYTMPDGRTDWRQTSE